MKLIKKEIVTNIEDFVYDIEVENNNNYFANGILVHNCKSPTSQQGKNLLKVNKAKHLIGATGTLLLNNPVDAYVPLKWIGAEHGTFTNFKYYYCNYTGQFNNILIGFRNLNILQDQIDKYSLRRTKDILDLPPKNIIHEIIEMEPAQAKFYNDLKEGIVKDSDVKEFGEKIYSEASRMSKLVEDIMKISKLESDKNIEKTELKLKNIVVAIVDSLMIEADKKNVKFKLFLNDCSIRGNYDSIYSLIFNLVDNAIKYNKTNGKITIKLQEVSNNVILSVKDTGIGIPKEDLDRIFERFYRVDKSRSKDSGGTGLGLAIVKHSLIVNNATIKVESELKKGSTFTVTF